MKPSTRIIVFIAIIASAVAALFLLQAAPIRSLLERPVAEVIRTYVTVVPRGTIIPSSTPPAVTSLASDTTLTVVGDVMLGRFVETLMDRHGEDYPFENISSTLAGSDALIGNVEGVINASHTHTANMSFSLSFSPQAPDVLWQNHFAIVSLGNNHGYDFGVDGFLQTEQALQAKGIIPVGNPYEVGGEYSYTGTIHGKQMTFVSFNATYPHFASSTALALVAQLKQKYPNTFLIALMHWGIEYKLNQNADQETFGHQLIDSGADLVIGGHPHVVEGIEKYKNHLIFYSLGNFIFDQYFSKDVQQELMLKLAIGSSSVTAQLVPVISMASQPQPMTGTAATDWLTQLAARSDPSLAAGIKQGTVSASY